MAPGKLRPGKTGTIASLVCLLLTLSFALAPSAAHGQSALGNSGEADISPEISAETVGVLAAPISRSEVLSRAASWTGVPYSQSDYHPTPYGEFRQDCSGFVSMTWGLPGRPADPNGGTNTVGLAGMSSLIAKDELRPGDALIDTEGDSNTRHVALFESWANPERTRYWAYEQAGPTGNLGAEHRIIEYPYDGGSTQFKPYRYNNIVEDGGSLHHRVRSAGGAWTPFGSLGMPSATQVASAAAPSKEVHTLAVSGGQIHHRVRNALGVWGPWGLVGNPGSASAVTAATDDGGNLQVAAILNGQPHHRIRYAGTGTWSAWGGVGATGSFTAVAGAIDTAGKVFHLTAVFNGQIHHRIRNTDSTWTPWAHAGNPGTALAIGATVDPDRALHLVATY